MFLQTQRELAKLNICIKAVLDNGSEQTQIHVGDEPDQNDCITVCSLAAEANRRLKNPKSYSHEVRLGGINGNHIGKTGIEATKRKLWITLTNVPWRTHKYVLVQKLFRDLLSNTGIGTSG